VVGGISLVADLGTLAVLHVALLPATAIAFTVSSFINFGFNRQWVFTGGRTGRARRQIARFYALVVLNLLSTLLITGGLTAIGLMYLIAKLVAAIANVVANFYVYRGWVFK
jgi:putative flippase GtrA